MTYLFELFFRFVSRNKYIYFVKTQAVAVSIEGRKKRGYMTALGFGYSQGMMFWVMAVIFYVGAVLVGDGDITFLEFFQAFFAVFLGAFGVGQVRTQVQYCTFFWAKKKGSLNIAV